MRPDPRWTVAGVAAVALAVRAALLAEPASPSVELAYAVARGWGADPSNVVPAYTLPSALWWQRPLAFLLAGPFAALGHLPFRVAVALAGAAPVPLAVAVALRLRASPIVAGLAGALVAIHLPLARAGTDAWPASLAAAFALGAFLAARAPQPRPILAGGLALAAAWCHPAGLLAPLALLVDAAVRAARRGEARLYPLELDAAATAALGALLLAPLPAAASWLLRDGRALLATGSWAAAGAVALAVLLPPLLAAALAPRRRAVLPALAAAALLVASPSWPEASSRDGDLDGVRAALGPEPWDTVFLVDVDWRLVPHPFADGARTVGWAYTTVSIPLGEWVDAVEGSRHTVLAKEDRPLNLALRQAYAECAVHEDARHVVLDGACTPGHGEAFRRAVGAG